MNTKLERPRERGRSHEAGGEREGGVYRRQGKQVSREGKSRPKFSALQGGPTRHG